MKKDLLKEELKRHMQLLEYTFYMPETEKDDQESEENLLLGAYLTEQDPVPGEDEEDPFAGDEEIAAAEEEVVTAEPVAPAEGGEEDPFAGGEEVEIEDEFATEEPVGGEETVEVDVTDIVDKAEETRTEINTMTAKMDDLLSKFGDLEGQISGMDKIINKIEDLEVEIEKRNPTPVEQLEMRSMDSFPYNVSLTDYWSDVEGYDTGKEEEGEEYTITQKDVDDYSKMEIEDSFDYNKDDEDENEF